jgi:hypothetical protein
MSKSYQLELDEEVNIKFQVEKYMMTITQTELIREFLAFFTKFHNDEWNYIGCWESYEG